MEVTCEKCIKKKDVLRDTDRTNGYLALNDDGGIVHYATWVESLGAFKRGCETREKEQAALESRLISELRSAKTWYKIMVKLGEHGSENGLSKEEADREALRMDEMAEHLMKVIDEGDRKERGEVERLDENAQ